MKFRKKSEPQLPDYFAGAPAEFTEAWKDLSDPARIRREMAALLLTEMRATGPAWPTDRYDMLDKILQGEL